MRINKFKMNCLFFATISVENARMNRLYLFYLSRQSITGTKNPFFESIFDDNGALIVSLFFILTFKKDKSLERIY